MVMGYSPLSPPGSASQPHHQRPPLTTNTGPPYRVVKFPCPFAGCTKSFDRKLHLQEHLFVHKNIKPYKCPVPRCNYDCRHKVSIKNHLKLQHATIAAAMLAKVSQNWELWEMGTLTQCLIIKMLDTTWSIKLCTLLLFG